MTKDETTWWLMPDRVVQDVKVMLKCAIEKVDDRCGETGCMCDLRGSYCSQPYQDALNAVESGLRKDELIGRLKKLAKEWRIRANEYDLKGWKSGSAWGYGRSKSYNSCADALEKLIEEDNETD